MKLGCICQWLRHWLF